MKKKEIKLPMEFEPGLMKYQPQLPPSKIKRKIQSNKILLKILLILILIFLFSGILIWFLK